MPVIRSGPRDDVDQTSRRSAEFGVEVSGQHLEFANCALADVERHEEFCFWQIGPRLVSVRAIDKPIGIEMIHAGKIRRGLCVTVAKLGCPGNEDAQIEELSASDRQIIDE